MSTTTATPRTVAGVYQRDQFHWVGDGFRVAQVIPGPEDLASKLSPFIMMDYHAPHVYEPTTKPRGVGVHPHRGFETVTMAFEGALAHHDSSGGGGVIREGDVQWMTAASGILHKEYHEEEWAKKGGRMHMMQLWVNLPAANKMDDPRYQALTAGEMGTVELEGGAGNVTVVAGSFNGVSGPAQTFTPINLWDVSLNAGGALSTSFPSTENAAIFVLEGSATVNGVETDAHQLVLLDHDGDAVEVTSAGGTRFVVLNGEPIDEPMVSYGPFVMNTQAEIVRAVNDFNAGLFGQLA